MTKIYHPLTEKIVDILVLKTNNNNRHFFRLLVGYYFSKCASMMRCNIQTNDRGVVPVNMYLLNLMVSGAGKGHSTNIMEHEFVACFKEPYLNKVFPRKAEENINTISGERATARCLANQSLLSVQEEAVIQHDKFTKQFERLGELAFSFDGGTSPAVKQMREKLQLASAGSMNLELDEIGSNMAANVDVLNTFLELYDVGLVKPKLIKNTAENIRSEELTGTTPANLMMFGTPTKLLDGDKIEEEFKQFLETGYARRLLFGYTTENHRTDSGTAKQRYDRMVDKTLAISIQEIQDVFASFAARPFNPILKLTETDSIHLIQYQMDCEDASNDFKEHQSVHKAEMAHRYYKALKLAGAYAFADNSDHITKAHLDYAISLVGDSGEAFHSLMRKQGPYERLANYLADCDNEVTQHELIEELPFYKGSEAQKKELMTLAMSYGYKHNIIIRKEKRDDIDFFTGETLVETDLSKVTAAFSKDIAYDYTIAHPPFNRMHKLTTNPGHHYTAHGFVNGHRCGENAIPGFNLLILDCDGDISMNAVKVLMEEYTYMLSTTKRHTAEINRFRLIFPISHRLKLSPEDYSKFMVNVFDWLPFPVDQSAKDIARKWESHKGHHAYNDGKVLDATMFIPQTKRSDETKAQITATGVGNIERWFREHTTTGNRASHLYRYGMVMVDSGMRLEEIISKMDAFNQSLHTPLSEAQFRGSTVLSISREHKKRGN